MNKRTVLLLASLSAFSVSFIQSKERPNIILFMVDDMGWQDTSLPFGVERTIYNDMYDTPNMERLAQQGMMFTQAYASSVSSPTRCSLLTGMNAARHRVTNWTLYKNKTTDAECDVLEFPKWNMNGVSQEANTENACQITSFVQLLKDNGYYTIHSGKAHFGAIGTPGEDPLNLGFDVNIAGHAAGGPASYLGLENFGNKTDGTSNSVFAIPGLEKYWGKDIFVSEALTIEAKDALKRANEQKKPFFLYMAHYAIHVPIDKDMRFYQKYIDRGLDEKDAAYAALIEGMDKSLGDLMNYLEEAGQSENTVILFMSDNGGYTTGSWWRSGELYTHNSPLRSGKGSAYEGGIRVPMIVSWPKTVKPGTKCNNYVIIEDFFSSILEIADIKDYNTVQEVDGKSFVPLLKEDTEVYNSDRAIIWNFPNKWDNEGPGIGPTCTIRKGDWKLIYYYKTGEKELFNISEDIGETTNLVSIKEELALILSQELGNELRRMNAQRPKFKSTGKDVPWPDEIK